MRQRRPESAREQPASWTWVVPWVLIIATAPLLSCVVFPSAGQDEIRSSPTAQRSAEEAGVGPGLQSATSTNPASGGLSHATVIAPPSEAEATGPALAAGLTRRTEISTGQMLNAMLGVSSYDPRWFYVRYDRGDWQPTYSEPRWDVSARGKLMNFRASRAVTNDDHLADEIEQPDANTDVVIANLDSYREHGFLMLTIGLQTHLGDGYGTAFNPDGSLKPDWLARARRLIEAADERGMIIQTYLFFQGHDQHFADEEAIRRAVRDYTDWLIANDYRNVIIEIANEYNHSGFDYDLIGSDKGMVSLIQLAKSRFTDLRLPVTVSSANRDFDQALRAVADITLIHGNNSSPEEDISAVSTLYASDSAPGPIVMNEDDNTKPNRNPNVLDGKTLADELRTATGIFRAGGSWGMMVEDWNQSYPYQWSLGADATLADLPQPMKVRNYVRAVHDGIKALTTAQTSVSLDRLYFPETRQFVSLGFKAFWERNGGLMVFGMPLSPEYKEKTITVQDFERQRFEWHPEFTGTPYDILLTRLGGVAAERAKLIETIPFQPLPDGAQSDGFCDFVPETRHRLCGGFRDYWRSHGLDLGDSGYSHRESLALFGYPISEEFNDPATGRTVQYFERARFEYHPQNPEPYRILLTRLGADLLGHDSG